MKDDLHGDGLLELAALLDLEHEIAAVDVLHDEVEPVHGLEARVQLDEERWLHGQREHVLLDERALDVVVLDDDVLLQDLDGVQLVRALALGQHHLSLGQDITSLDLGPLDNGIKDLARLDQEAPG